MARKLRLAAAAVALAAVVAFVANRTLPLDGEDARSAALIPTSRLASSAPTAPPPVVAPAPSEAPDTPSRMAKKPSAPRPVDPLKPVVRSAASCRRQHDAAD